MLTVKQVNTYIQQTFPDLFIERCHNYFIVWSDKDDIQLKLAGLYQHSIHVYGVNHLTLPQWLERVKDVVADNGRSEWERSPVYPSPSNQPV